MATYTEDEWEDIRATGSPGPRNSRIYDAPSPPPGWARSQTLVGHIDDDTVCGNCGHAAGWHDFGLNGCNNAWDTPDSCECCLFEPSQP